MVRVSGTHLLVAAGAAILLSSSLKSNKVESKTDPVTQKEYFAGEVPTYYYMTNIDQILSILNRDFTDKIQAPKGEKITTDWLKRDPWTIKFQDLLIRRVKGKEVGEYTLRGLAEMPFRRFLESQGGGLGGQFLYGPVSSNDWTPGTVQTSRHLQVVIDFTDYDGMTSTAAVFKAGPSFTKDWPEVSDFHSGEFRPN
jgi:hypothetical protein